MSACFAAFEVGEYREIRDKTKAEEPFDAVAFRELKHKYMTVRARDTGEAADLNTPNAPVDNDPVLAPVVRQAIRERDNEVAALLRTSTRPTFNLLLLLRASV